MARYQGQVAVFRASIPLGVPVESTPPPKNFIDELVFAKLKTLGVPPSAVCDDATFLRRVGGRHCRPAADGRRDRSVPGRHQPRTSARPGSTRCWPAPTTPTTSPTSGARSCATSGGTDADARGTRIFHDWIRDSLHANMPYDQFARQLLTATGEIGHNPPVAWYREVNDDERAGRGHGPVVPGPAHSVRPLPSPSVRKVEPAGLLRLRGVLLAHAAQAGRAGRAKSASSTTAAPPRPRIPRPGRPCRRPAWAPSRPRSRPRTIRGRRWSTG